jgi:hypothetical protein
MRQTTVTQDGSTGLNRFNDFRADIACQAKPSGIGVYFHGSSKGLLGRGGHTISLVQYYDLLTTLRKGHLVHGKRFDAIADNIDAAGIGRV